MASNSSSFEDYEGFLLSYPQFSAPIALSEPPGATMPEPASEAVEDEPATDRTASQPGEGLGLGAALRSGTAAAAATTAAVIQTAAETASSLIPPM